MLALAVAAAGIAVSVWLHERFEREQRSQAQVRFSVVANGFSATLLERLRDSTAIMSAVAAQYRVRGELDRESFERFTSQILAERRVPGLSAIAWAPRVRAAERAPVLARLRREWGGDFAIHPDPGGADSLPVAYIAASPEEAARALGFDILSEAQRRAASERAVGENRVAMTPLLIAATDPPDAGPRSVVMLLPVFDDDVTLADPEERPALVRGFVAAAFRADELVSSITLPLAGVYVRVSDLADANTAWQATDAEAPPGALLVADEVVSFGGRLLRIDFRSTPKLEQMMLSGSARQAGLFAIALTAVLALLAFNLASGRQRAEAAVARATADLRQSEERFALAAQVAADAIWERNLVTGRAVGSPRVEALLGLPDGAIARDDGTDPDDLIHPDDRPSQQVALANHLERGAPYAVDYRMRHAQGHWLWLRVRGVAQRDAAGRAVRMIGTMTDISSERREGERLAGLQAFLRRVLDAIPDPVIVKGRDQRYLMVNEAYARWMGCPAEEVIGRSVRDFFAPELAERAVIVDDRVFSTGVTQVADQLWPDRRYGGMRSFRVQKALCLGPDGEPLVVGAHHDVTELRDAVARFQAAIDDTPLVAVVGMDPDGRVTVWNRAAAEFFGSTAAEAIGQPAQELVVPAGHRAGFAELCLAVWKTGLPTPTEEFEVRTGTGHRGWVLGAIFPVVRDGRVLETFVMGVDITARRSMEERLRVSEERLRLVLDATTDGIWDFDPRTRRTYFTDRFHAMLGFRSNAELHENFTFRDAVHPEDRAAAVGAQDEVLRAGGRFDRVFRLRHADGGYRWFHGRGNVILDAQGRPERFIGALTDISREKGAEEELRRHRDDLAELVRERTADLLRAKESAEQANMAKSEFLANMTHELRTPMHAILSFARLGRAKVAALPPERMAAYLDKVLQGGERLLALIDDLLDLSRLEAGKMPVELRQADLAAVCRQVIDEMAPLSDAKALHVVLDQDAQPAVAAIDARRLGQVIGNLLSNAVKFSPVGGRVTVALRATTMPAGRRAGDEGRIPALCLSVADEGVGIPETELESVFDKFVQSTRTRSGAGGTGLGLAICREIVLAHRGIIRASNRETGGALFEVLIPRT